MLCFKRFFSFYPNKNLAPQHNKTNTAKKEKRNQQRETPLLERIEKLKS